MTTGSLGSTYRLQLHQLGFDGARRLVGYLAALGVSTLYVSPVLQATRASTHGYDVADPTRLDAGLGTRSDFEALLAELDRAGMRLLIDIVPNHMAATPENSWWWEVLRDGPQSEHARLFDIDWEGQAGRVLLPSLSAPLRQASAGARVRGGVLEMDGQRFPLRRDESHSGEVPALIDRQHYRPSYWRLARDQINYRRFFDVDALVGVRVEDPAVFEKTHRFALQLCADKRVAGVRVDHVDGLADPAGYLQRLAAAMSRSGDRPVVLIEKILARGEEVPAQWATDGTTGYEFADLAGGLFVDGAGAAAIALLGEELTGEQQSFAALRTAGKAEMLGRSFRSELKLLSALALFALDRGRPGHDLSAEEIAEAVTAMTVNLDVYRTYLAPGVVAVGDRRRLRRLAKTCELSPEGTRALRLLLEGLELAVRPGDPWWQFARRWQQLTGADMAKGVEDTASYRYSGLLGHAEVGSDPDRACATPAEFARLLNSRRTRPSSLNATSTHDSKRSEDARARLYVLSEAPGQWASLVRKWHRHAGPTRSRRPDAHDELLLYQSFFALWPFGASRLEPAQRGRLEQYVVKAAREAKRRSNWTDPDSAYETALVSMVRRLAGDGSFSRDMARFARRLGAACATNALALLVLKCVAPGVPDFYQGTELPAAVLTDPDNRRPVDWNARAGLLAALPGPGQATAADLAAMALNWGDGRLKMFVTRALLQLRRENPELFDRAPFRLLTASGSHAENVVALARTHRRRVVIAVVPRLALGLCPAGRFATGGRVWGDTELRLPAAARGELTEILTGARLQPTTGRVAVGDLLRSLPVAVLRSS